MVEFTVSSAPLDGLVALPWFHEEHRGDREQVTGALVKFCKHALRPQRYAPGDSPGPELIGDEHGSNGDQLKVIASGEPERVGICNCRACQRPDRLIGQKMGWTITSVIENRKCDAIHDG